MPAQLWTLINYLPISTSKTAAEQRTLQAEYLKVRNELNATSSQDQFAKWAKIRRQHDKLLEKLEASSTLPLTKLCSRPVSATQPWRGHGLLHKIWR